VTIFSEERHFEPFDEFIRRNYTLQINTDVGEAWKAMISSDLLVISRSTFSLVPALFTHGKVLFIPKRGWNIGGMGWTAVKESILNETSVKMEQLLREDGCDPELALLMWTKHCNS
jgi:hypothetical protein